MLVDEEFRRDARFFNESSARSRVATTLGIPVASVNPVIVGARINQINADRAASNVVTCALPPPSPCLAPLNIGNFNLANDTVWPGLTSTNLRARLVNGGFTLYSGLQVQMNGRLAKDDISFLSMGEHRLLRGVDYTISYALARAEATAGSGRQEFITNTSRNNERFNSAFGPTGNDRTHLFGAGLIINTIGGFNINPTFRFGSAPPVTLTVPFLDGAGCPFSRSTNTLPACFAAGNYLFTTDINGDGGSGTSRTELLSGTNHGALGSSIGSWRELNQIITSFNQRYAGLPTPQGQRLLDAGIFSLDQLRQIGAVVKPINLVPENNPWPFQGRFSADVRVTRPVKFLERVTFEPYLEVFNLFNNTPKGTYAGLNHRAFGNLNVPYSQADLGDLDGQVRGLLQNPRQFQFGFRVSF
ncbi:MAG: hypothetical protein ACREBG_10205 [Pyrinomonadaceae bacterium]